MSLFLSSIHLYFSEIFFSLKVFEIFKNQKQKKTFYVKKSVDDISFSGYKSQEVINERREESILKEMKAFFFSLSTSIFFFCQQRFTRNPVDNRCQTIYQKKQTLWRSRLLEILFIQIALENQISLLK